MSNVNLADNPEMISMAPHIPSDIPADETNRQILDGLKVKALSWATLKRFLQELVIDKAFLFFGILRRVEFSVIVLSSGKCDF